MLSIENIRKAFEFFPKPCMILLNDAPKYTIKYVNRAFIKVVDFYVDAMIGRGIFEAFPANDAEKDYIYNLLENTSSNGQIYPIVDKGNVVTFFFYCPLDIKEFLAGTRIVMEDQLPDKSFLHEHLPAPLNALTESQQTRDILESISDAFFAMNKDDNVIYWNRRAEKVTDISREKILGLNLWEVYPEAKSLRFYTEYKKARSENTAINFEEYFPQLNLWFGVTIYPASDGVSVYFKNISERIKSDEALHRSEQRFKALVQEGADLIGIIDATGKYLYVSPTSEKVLNISPEFFIGKNAFDFIHDDDRMRVFNELSLIATQKRIHISPYRFKNGDHTFSWIETVATDLIDEPTVAGIVVNSRDVTQLIENEIKLKETIGHFEDQNCRLREISWMQSHVVRAPLARIMGLAELLSMEDKKESRKQLIAHLKDSANELDKIIWEIVKKTEGL